MSLRCSNSKCSVEHTSAENEAVTSPASLVLPVFPYEVAARISLSCSAGHDGTDQDGDEDTSQDQKQADLCDGGKGAVHEHDDRGRYPCHDEVYYEDVPSLIFISIVEETVHGDDLIGENGRDRCSAEEPTEEVPPV
jgi:hypothetical protein